MLFTSAVHEGGSLRYNVFSTAADGGGAPVRLTTGASWQKASAVKYVDAGETVLYNVRSLPGRGPGAAVPGTDHDIWQQRMDASSSARALVATPGYEENEAAFSPDGRWIAYTSNESGRPDVYVKGYPDGPKTVVSPEGGETPVWNPKTGDEVFYQAGASVFAVSIVNGRRVGPAKQIFERAFSDSRNWDVAPDGQHFLVAEDVGPLRINVITNWFEGLRAKVPRARSGRASEGGSVLR